MGKKTNYFIGKGPLFIADNDANGVPGALEDVGEVTLMVEITKEYKSNFSTRNEVNEKDAHVPVSQEVKGTITLKERTAKNLQLILHGTQTTKAGSSVVASAFPAGIVAGEEHRLPGFTGIASSLVITDSAGAPVPLVLGTNYTVDLNYGRVKFLLVTGFTQPFKASFTNAASKRVSLLTKRVVNKFLRFEGINIGNNAGPRKFLEELYDCTLMPAQKLDEKGEDYSTYEIQFECMADQSKEDDLEFGKYGNFLELE
jgi:hypothetical protein